MNLTGESVRSGAARRDPRPSTMVLWLAASCASLLLAVGCQKAPSAEPAQAADAKGTADAKDAADAKDKDKDKPTGEGEGVTLKPEEIDKVGIKTTPAVTTLHAPETIGYAVVTTREAIAQAVADLNTAAAMEHQSRAALTRSRGLAGTPGATPVEAQEAAERQAAVDHAALMLAERRLSAVYGSNAPWKNNYASPELSALASGEIKLVRVTFPLGAIGPGVPAKLRVAHMGESPGTKSFESHTVWSAPADVTVPGRSFFVALKGTDVSEGERLLAWVGVGAAESGVMIPFEAVLMNGGKYWCYVEEKPGVFVRTEVDTSVPTDEGYFIKEGVESGSHIVTSSAGQLLARELGTAAAD